MESKRDQQQALYENIQMDMNELGGDENMELSSSEGEKLITMLKLSYENHRKLRRTCQEKDSEIKSKSAEIEKLMKQYKDDQTEIERLRVERSEALEMKQASLEKEKTATKMIRSLQQKIASLAAAAQENNVLSMNVNNLKKANDELTVERNELRSELETLRVDLETVKTKLQEAENENTKAKKTIVMLQHDITVQDNELMRVNAEKKKQENALKQLRADVEAKQSEITVLSEQCQVSNEQQTRTMQQLVEEKSRNDKISRELKQLHTYNTKLQQENDQTFLSLEQLKYEHRKQAAQLKMKLEEAGQLKQEIVKMKKISENKLRQVQDQKLKLKQKNDKQKTQLTSMEKKLEIAQKQKKNDHKTIKQLNQEKTELNMNMIKTVNTSKKRLKYVKLNEHANKMLRQEILNYKDNVEKQGTLISQLEKERDQAILQANNLTERMAVTVGELKLREMENCELKKRIVDADRKHKHQLNLYEALRADRNTYHRKVLEAQCSIAEMESNVDSLTQKNGKLSEAVDSQEKTLAKYHIKFHRLQREKETLNIELLKIKQDIQKSKQDKDTHKEEQQKWQKVIADTLAEKALLKKEVDQLNRKQGKLEGQLEQRNNELMQLQEKFNVQQSVLKMGETQYRQRTEEIRQLKLEIKKLYRENNILTKSVNSAGDCKLDVQRIQRDLFNERARRERLQKELETPMHIHRWRSLEAADPGSFELLQHKQRLQRCRITRAKLNSGLY